MNVEILLAATCSVIKKFLAVLLAVVMLVSAFSFFSFQQVNNVLAYPKSIDAIGEVDEFAFYRMPLQ